MTEERFRCKVQGCRNRARARGWCIGHYTRWYRHGDPRAATPLRIVPLRVYRGRGR